jgi:hypothetical protein
MAQAVAQRLALPAQGLGELVPSIAAWLLGFAPVSVLALAGGGYDAIIRSQAGIAVWWILALGCLVGAIKPAFPSRRARVAAGLLAALGVWSWIGLAASDSPERTLSEVARIATYLGVLLLGLMTLDRRRAPTVLLGVASAIALVACLAVLSRLEPGLFPANETGELLPIARHRLNWPLNYWNGLAALCALGIPLALALAAGHRRVAVRALCAAALPVIALCISLTISRGGIAAAALGVVILLVAGPARPRVLASFVLGGVASAILVAAAAQRGLVHEDLRSGAALQQGDEVVLVMLVVAAGTGLVQAGIALLEPFQMPGFVAAPPRPTGRQVMIGAAAGLLLAVLVAVAAGLPGRLNTAWEDFKSPAREHEVSQNYDASRLGSFSSNGRYQLWSVALDSLSDQPLMGSGAGTYEFAWLRGARTYRSVRDAHSLYIELAAETGIPGLVLGLGFVVALLGVGRERKRLDPGARLVLAAALAGVVAFAFAAAVDWVWELPAIAVAAMLLAAVAFTAGRPPVSTADSGPGWRRAALAATMLIPIGILAVVLAGASSLEESRASARAGDLPVALEHAVAAHSVDAAAATPLLQAALIRERADDPRGAAADARAAARREPLNWRIWLVLARVEALGGRPAAAVAAYRRARALNPNSVVFRR